MITNFEPKSKYVIASFSFGEGEYTYEVKLGNFESNTYLYVWRSPDAGYVYAQIVSQSQCMKIQELIEQNNKKLFETIKGMIESSN